MQITTTVFFRKNYVSYELAGSGIQKRADMDDNLSMWEQKNKTSTLCLKLNWTPETFYYNFAKIALTSIKTGTQNLHMTQ